MIVDPWQTAGDAGKIAPGSGLTVNKAVVRQPAPSVYVIVVVAAEGLPVTTPVAQPVEPMVATAVELLLQLPPEIALNKQVVAPWHTLSVPTIGPGVLFTVTIVVLEQPVTDDV